MSFSAIIPASDMDAANAELDAQGFGPTNFSIPAYDGARAGYATLHAWSDPAFQAGQTIRVDQDDALVATVTGIHSANLLLIDPHVTVGSGQMIEIEQ